MRLRPRFRLGPRKGSLQRAPDSLLDLRGRFATGTGRKGREEKGRREGGPVVAPMLNSAHTVRSHSETLRKYQSRAMRHAWPGLGTIPASVSTVSTMKAKERKEDAHLRDRVHGLSLKYR